MLQVCPGRSVEDPFAAQPAEHVQSTLNILRLEVELDLPKGSRLTLVTVHLEHVGTLDCPLLES